MDAAAFQKATGVSRETRQRLEAYAAHLIRWQKAINLGGPRTVSDLWRRHMLDSAQLFPLLPAGARSLVDLGSGAGFPGLVLAIMGVADVHLVESDSRKATFIREAARITGAGVTVHATRIEAEPAFAADVVTSRALAPLDRLRGYATRFWAPDTVGLFLKGQDIDAELTTASKCWKFTAQRVPSRSDPSGVMLRVGGLAGADADG
jgi:16S rRNA (guanine527-N7)-methyltransferase